MNFIADTTEQPCGLPLTRGVLDNINLELARRSRGQALEGQLDMSRKLRREAQVFEAGSGWSSQNDVIAFQPESAPLAPTCAPQLR